MTLQKTEPMVEITSDIFTNKNLYNAAILLNPDDTVSLRIGAIGENTDARQILLDRLIYAGHRIKERTAHLVADYNFNTNRFSVFCYQNVPEGISVPLREEEEKQAIAVFKEKYFISEQAFEEFKASAIKTAGKAHENIQASKEQEDVKPTFNRDQMLQIRWGLEAGLDVRVYAKPVFTWAQMNEIRQGLEKGLDVSSYANSQFSWNQMREIRNNLKDSEYELDL